MNEHSTPGGALAELWEQDEARGIDPRSIPRTPAVEAPPLRPVEFPRPDWHGEDAS